jgi:hypothetical protein
VRSNATAVERSDHVRTQVYVSDHVSPHFPCCPSRTSLQPCAAAIICVRPQIGRSNAPAVEPSAYTRTHAARWCTCGRTRTKSSNACGSTFERNSLRSNAPLTWQHVLFLSINRTRGYHLFSDAWETLGTRLRCPLWPKTSPFFIVNTPKCHFDLMLLFILL